MFSSLQKQVARLSVATTAAAALLLMAGGPARAQQGVIAGQVVDASSLEPLVGAQVFIPDANVGTLTDEDGRYRITGVPAGQVPVRARLVGYRQGTRTVTVRPGQTTTQNFELGVSAISLEELVVTATGRRRYREIGHSVSTIDAAQQVDRSEATTLTDLIQGRSTGVTISRTSGTTGAGSEIRIRGAGSINLSNTPLLYVDGARINNDLDRGVTLITGGQDPSALNDINPEDIESIEIVKGPAATALYGTAAQAGVIRITTKRGRAGDTRYTLRGEVGSVFDDVDASWPEVAYNTFRDPTLSLAGLEPFGVRDTTYLFDFLQPGGEPGIDDPFRTGLKQTYGVSVRGGVESVNYFVSGEFDQEEGNLPSNNSDQFSARANFSLNP